MDAPDLVLTAPAQGTPAPAPSIKLSDVVADKPPVVPTLDISATPLPEAEDPVDPLPVKHSDIPALDEEAGPIKAITKDLVGPQEAQPHLVLLGAEVLPGTSTRLEWSPDISFMGIAAPTAVLVVNGVRAGPTLCLTAAVHGDELNGIEITRRVLYNINPNELSGAVIGVPIVNLQGFRRSSRYLPDRRDLNRFFPGNTRGSSASRIAASFFQEVIVHCDLLIDLHTGSFHRTNLPQLRADLSSEEVKKFAKKMGAIVVVQSRGASGSLRRAAVQRGIPAVTLEAGAPHELQRDAVEHGVKSVETAMNNLGMLKRRRFWERTAEPIYYRSSWVRSKEGGILFSEVNLGADVKAGDLLGVVTDPITNMRHEIIAPFHGRVIGMALNQVMYPGFAAYHIGLQASAENVAEPSALMVDPSNPNPDSLLEEEGVMVHGDEDARAPAVPEDEVRPIEALPVEDSE